MVEPNDVAAMRTPGLKAAGRVKDIAEILSLPGHAPVPAPAR
jgi:hypothetical protein